MKLQDPNGGKKKLPEEKLMDTAVWTEGLHWCSEERRWEKIA